MTRAHAAKANSDKMSPEDINDSADVLGRQIWRVVPYAKKYPKRVLTGIFANAAARFFDLMPFVATVWPWITSPRTRFPAHKSFRTW